MMLSPQAARMGTVHTTLRRIGVPGRSLWGAAAGGPGRRVALFSSSRSSGRLPGRGRPLTATTTTSNNSSFTNKEHHLIAHPNSCWRFQSSRAAAASAHYDGDSSDDDDDDDDTTTTNNNNNSNNIQNHHRSAGQPWTINLGRGDDDAWLVGPRDPARWYTGVAPTDPNCPGADGRGVIRSLPLPNLSAVTRARAEEYFNNSWTLYETLFAGLNGEEGFYRPPPHGLRHPQIFYYGHTACLYVNKLRVAGVLRQPVNAYFESIFEVGVDEMLWDDMHKNTMLWPTVSEVHHYRKQVYETVVDAIRTHDSLDDGNNSDSDGVLVNQRHPMWALFMGFEHERIHLETSSVLFRETPFHLVQAPAHWPPLHPSAAAVRNGGDGNNSDSDDDPRPTSHPVEGRDYPPNRMLAVNNGDGSSSSSSVDLGKPADFPSFGWDNEYGERRVDVPPFWASEHMVTNGEFWHFVADGGYRTADWWSDDGWAWRTHRNLKWPYFWEPAGPAGSHEFGLRTIFDIVDMPWDWPVDVTYYEAKAYCAWKTARDGGSPAQRPYRLLTEAEHHLIRRKDHSLEAARRDVAADKVMVTSGKGFGDQGEIGANLNLAYSSQNPVDFFAPSETGHRDTTGSAWEWTEDHFNPLKGFEVHHVYDDFSTPCFDGKHSMIVGGSFVSTGDEASVFARFHFRPHFLQHSGFRLVASDADAPATHLYAGNFDGQAAARDAALAAAAAAASSEQPTATTTSGADDSGNSNVYETDDSLHMYLGLHYPSSGNQENVPAILEHENAPHHGLRFPQRVVGLLNSLKPASTNQKALDIGCAVGGASFELAKTFNEVDAFDFSSSFVNAAKRMQSSPESVRFRIPIEAELYEEVQAVHETDVTQAVRAKVNFFTGDACQIAGMAARGALTTYDGVVMSNLLCRLPDPMACLNGLPSIVNQGGVIVMVTPFSWLTEFTPRGKWLGGFQDPVSKEAIHSKDVLKEVMEERGFEKIHEEQMPLIIREHQRKFQYIISEATGWRKVD